METEFTKGKWYVGKIFPMPILHVNKKKICIISKELPIAEREANARLISAAPDLFACCQEIMDKTQGTRYFSEETFSRITSAMKKAS